MSGLVLIEPNELYNLLNQESSHPSLSDAVFMLLIDARAKDEYNESHIITAKRATKNELNEFVVPFDADLECKTHVIVYDSKTSSLIEESPAILCALKIWEMGSRNLVEVLNGGYEAFSAIYPFHRTQKMLYMPQELDLLQTYPAEIIQQQLYLGNWQHGNAAFIQKELKIRGHVNCCEQSGTFFVQDGLSLLHIAVSDVDEPAADLLCKFEETCTFINNHIKTGQAVLVYSQLGISRAATIIIAFLMKENNLALHNAYNFVVRCRPQIRPNRGFMSQLATWEALLNKNKVEGITESVLNFDKETTDD